MVVFKGLNPCKLQSIVNRETDYELRMPENIDPPFTTTRHLYPRRGTVEENADFIILETDSVGDSDHISIIINGSPTNPSGSNALNQPFESTGLPSSPPFFSLMGLGMVAVIQATIVTGVLHLNCLVSGSLKSNR